MTTKGRRIIQEFKHRAFRSDDAMRKIPVDPEFAQFIVEEVRRLFPYRRIRPPKIQFMRRRTRWLRGRYKPSSNTIQLFPSGQNLATLLHEIAHMLDPERRAHHPGFYQICDLLEKELFSREVPHE